MRFLRSACIESMYRELPFLERFRAAREDGFDFVEFWSWEDKDLAAVRSAAAEAGIAIAGFNGDGPFSLIDPAQKEDYLDYLRRSVAAAQTLGARAVTIHSNGPGGGRRGAERSRPPCRQSRRLPGSCGPSPAPPEAPASP